jgi:hypothetical protein
MYVVLLLSESRAIINDLDVILHFLYYKSFIPRFSYQAELHERYVTSADSPNVNFQNDKKTITSAIKMYYRANRVETHGNHQVSIILCVIVLILFLKENNI